MDFSSWQGVLTTLIGLALITLVGVGIRLLVMMTVQKNRERENRQINERLRTLIAAYKVLGGSFTGNLAVDPTHKRDLLRRTELAAQTVPAVDLVVGSDADEGSERTRRIRDAVEAALSDILLLGTETHIRLAERAAQELVAGRPVHTHELVVSLRDFIRKALDLDPVPEDGKIPMQGPTRPSNSGSRGKEDRGTGDRKGGGGGSESSGAGLGIGMGIGGGRLNPDATHDDPDPPVR